jgi:uncharacterized protein
VIHVVPRASQTEVAGKHGDAVRIRVSAPPVNGAANDELVRFIARRLGVSRASVTIAHGNAGRRKTVTIEGLTTDAALKRLLETT